MPDFLVSQRKVKMNGSIKERKGREEGRRKGSKVGWMDERKEGGDETKSYLERRLKRR